MSGARRIQAVSAGAGGVEGAGDFLADVRRLAGAGDTDPAGAAAEQLDGINKGVIETIGDLEQGSRFFANDLAGIGEPVEELGRVDNLQRHGRVLARSSGERRGVSPT